MRTCITILTVAVVGLLTTLGSSQSASAQNVQGSVRGVELITQDLGGRAVFLFSFVGQIDGRRRPGIGFVAMNHTPLPRADGEPATILSGDGTLYVGFRRYAIRQLSGPITVNEDGPFFLIFPLQFNVQAQLLINGVSHQFQGVLRHDTLPFSLSGTIVPSS